MIAVPSMMTLLALFLLFWQYLKVVIEGHANMANDFYIPNSKLD